MTGARRGEISWAALAHMSTEQRAYRPAAQLHKTGRETGKPRIIAPADSGATDHRLPARRRDRTTFIFSPSKGARALSLAKPWRAIRPEAGLPKGIGLHGLRHALATPLAVGGAQAAEIMSRSGHRQLGDDHALSALWRRLRAPPWPSAPPRLHWRAWLPPAARPSPTCLRCRPSAGGRDGEV